MKWLAPVILLIAIVFSLGACVTSWQKPTGLEGTSGSHQENNLENNAEAFEIDGENAAHADENIAKEAPIDTKIKDESTEKHTDQQADENSKQEDAKSEKTNKESETTLAKNGSSEKSNS